MQYRASIDGLRALAVILVLLFHGRVGLFSGGYIGVDVFFVISGYLITTLIVKDQATGHFSLVGFYERRIRRIFPALFLVVFATLAVAAMVMLPPDLSRLGASVLSTSLFAANFHFWKQRLNYLLDKPDFEPLLHTWSLAIEEQFYLLFPIFLLALIRFFKRLDLVFLSVAAASLALSVYLSATRPHAAFYFSPSRAWELMLGAWLAATNVTGMVPRRLIPVLQWAGLVMIVGAAVGYGSHTQFPGLAALVPCTGTALLIAWCDRKSRVIGGLSHPAVVWVGLISYPLYLWHWPLLVLARHALLREPTTFEIALLYFLSAALAAATWHYLEKPIRARNDLMTAGRVFVVAAGVGCLAVTIGGGLRATEGLWAAPPPTVARMLAAAKDYAPFVIGCQNWDPRERVPPSACALGDSDRPDFDFAVWGDSHAGAITHLLATIGRDIGQKGLQLTSDNCIPLLQAQVFLNGVATDCGARNEAAFEILRRYRVRRVILAAAWVQYLGDFDKVLGLSDALDAPAGSIATFQLALKQTIDLLRAAGIEVMIVGPVPDIGWNVPSVLAATEWRRRPLPNGPSIGDHLAESAESVARPQRAGAGPRLRRLPA